MNYGKYVVIEGVDFSGKSTTINNLYYFLKSKGIDALVTKHPGSTWIGEKIRTIVKDPNAQILDHTRAMLFAVDNAAFHEQHAKPMRNDERWLLADRNNFASALAYQMADGLSLEEIKQIHSSIIDPRKIDHLFVLDIDYETRQQRKALRESKEGVTSDYYERDREHFDKLRNAYLNLRDQSLLHPYVCSTNGNLNIHVINANADGAAILTQITDCLQLQ